MCRFLASSLQALGHLEQQMQELASLGVDRELLLDHRANFVHYDFLKLNYI